MSRQSIRFAALLVVVGFAFPVWAALPPGTRGWEVVPNAIRADGIDSFALQVEVTSPVAAVTLQSSPLTFDLPGGQAMQTLRDDGKGADRVAGDMVYTSDPIRYNADSPFPFPDHYRFDPSSPAGLDIQGLGNVTIHEVGGGESTFLVQPEVGLLRPDVPPTQITTLAPDVAASPHLVNVRTSGRETQHAMRFLASNLANLSQPIYNVLPDAFDFLALFSTNKIEHEPAVTSTNFNAGVHQRVQVNYTGTGSSPFDLSGSYGSDGRLLGISMLDAMQRGIDSANATHELLHQWSYYLAPALELEGTFAHPDNRSNVASLLGGFEWLDNGDGTYSINADEGRNGATHVSALDAYLMGLADGSDVGTLYKYDDASLPPLTKVAIGEPITAEEIVVEVTLADIQMLHGVRTPTPDTAQRDFAIGFVAESHDRLLTLTEMTFYEILAAHYTSEVPANDPDPHHAGNWAPITRFFGHGTTWSTAVPLPPQLPGDYNDDGVVDAADYTVWRDNLGTDFALNGNGDESDTSAGVVDQADYSLWVDNFGSALADSSESSGVVPEPASVSLAGVALFALSGARHRRKRRR